MNSSSPVFIYGGWPVREGLAANLVSQVLIAHGASGEHINAVVKAARQQSIPVSWVSRQKLDGLANGNHQGIVAQTRALGYSDINHVWAQASHSDSKGPRLLFLDGILDPQNFGSILRSAAYFGVPGVIVPKRRAAPLTSSVLRASAGAAFQVPIAEVSNLGMALEVARKKGFWVVGADMSGEDIRIADIPRPLILVMGSEGEGLHQGIKKKCDVIVSIKKFAKSSTLDSLNVGVACGVLLHQLT